jgi:hypothetical protein
VSTTAKTQPAPAGRARVNLADADLSPAVKAIESAYRAIRRRHPEVPAATIVVKRDDRAWGHTTVAKVWGPKGAKSADRLEIMISGENLSRGAAAVVATLLHEAAHAADLAAGILDTDVNGRHNRKFADRAESFGLTVKDAGRLGWTLTTMSKAQRESWAATIALVDRGLAKAAAARHPVAKVNPTTGKPVPVPGKGISGPRTRTGNRNLARAVCGCGKVIRASLGTLAACQPTCQACGEAFAVAA